MKGAEERNGGCTIAERQPFFTGCDERYLLMLNNGSLGFVRTVMSGPDWISNPWTVLGFARGACYLHSHGPNGTYFLYVLGPAPETITAGGAAFSFVVLVSHFPCSWTMGMVILGRGEFLW